MEKRYILFDLDGTLVNSYAGISGAFDYALTHLGVKPNPDTYIKCIGPPVPDSLRKYYGLNDETIDDGVRLFREYYEKNGVYECSPYPEMELVLKTLNAHGKKLMVATAKPERLAIKMLDNLGISEQFCFVSGVNFEGAFPPSESGIRSSKDDVIAHVLRANAILDPENAVMVGDRSGDIIAAKKFGLQTIGAAYGFGSEDELIKAGAEHIAYDPMQLVEIIVQS